MPQADPMLVTLTASQLRGLIDASITDALAEFSPAQPEGLIDRAELARRLCMSTRGLDRLRREGMPELRVGDVPRWNWARCLEWLESRQNGEETDLRGEPQAAE